MSNSQRDLFAAGGASVATLTCFLFCADGSVIGVYEVPGFIMALEGVDTGLTVGVFCTGQPNWCTPRQTKLLLDCLLGSYHGIKYKSHTK